MCDKPNFVQPLLEFQPTKQNIHLVIELKCYV